MKSPIPSSLPSAKPAHVNLVEHRAAETRWGSDSNHCDVLSEPSAKLKLADGPQRGHRNG